MFKILTFRSEAAFWPLAERTGAEAGTGASGTLLGKAMAMARRFRADHAARRAMHELESLDDRTLRDIGVSRDQIWHAVRHGRGATSRDAFDIARWS